MRSLDTNILVRWLVKDDVRQAAKVRDMLQSTIESGERLFIPVTVALELEWVLRSRYSMPKPSIIKALVSLLETSEVVFQFELAIERAVNHYRRGNADFADCLHLGLCSAENNLPLVTFDKKAARLDGAALL